MILVGTYHADLEGPYRLGLMLSHFLPKVITLELPANITVEEAFRKTLVARELMAKVTKSLNMPQFLVDYFCDFASSTRYEIAVSATYAKNSGAQLYPVDHPQRPVDFDIFNDETNVASTLKDAADLFIKEFEGRGRSIDLLSGISYAEVRAAIVKQHDEVYSTGREAGSQSLEALLTKSQSLEALLTKQLGEAVIQRMSDASFAEEREQFMAAQVLQIFPDMHIGGLMHTHPLPERGLAVPLYERLGKAVSQAIKLCNAEALVKAAQ